MAVRASFETPAARAPQDEEVPIWHKENPHPEEPSRAWRRAASRRTLDARPNSFLHPCRAGEARQPGDEMRDVRLQRRVVLVRNQRLLVHVEGALDLDLQGMATLRRDAVAAHDLDAFVRVVDLDAIAAPLEETRDKVGELGRARGPVAVAKHEIGALAVRPVARHRAAARWHGVAIDQPDDGE